jgi:DNA-binding NarL/FixJ family response regulator
MKILVVDDHPLFLDGLLQVLQQLRPNVTAIQVGNAEEALEYIDTDRAIDLILLDINMPGMDGLDLLATLVERELWIPAIVISAHDNPRVILQALNTGALGFIPKYFNTAELLSALNVVLKGEVFLPEPIKARIDQLRRVNAKTGSLSEKIALDLGLSSRQVRVLECLAKGYSNRKIATILNLSEHTVKSHLKVLFSALKAENRTDCVRKAEEMGLITAIRIEDSEPAED